MSRPPVRSASRKAGPRRIEKRIDPVSIWWSPGQIAASKCADTGRVTPRKIGLDVWPEITR